MIPKSLKISINHTLSAKQWKLKYVISILNPFISKSLLYFKGHF